MENISFTGAHRQKTRFNNAALEQHHCANLYTFAHYHTLGVHGD